MEKIGKIAAYISYPADRKTETAVVIFPDFLGHEFVNVQLIADDFAAHGFLAVIPDIYEGDVVPLNWTEGFDIMGWGGRHMPPQVDPIIETFIKDLRSGFGVERLGGVGYCFGAKYLARFLGKGVDVGAMAHPSYVDVEEIKGIGGPLVIAAAETDHIFSEVKRHETERLLREGGKTYQLTLFSGVEHGFAVKADLSKKEARVAKKAAFAQQVMWFEAWLGGKGREAK